MKRITRTLALLVSLTLALFVGVGAASSASAAPPLPDAGAVVDAAGQAVNDVGTLTHTFDGTATVDRIERVGGQLFAVGELNGTVTDVLTGVVTPVVDEAFRAPVNLTQSGSGAECEILDLVLGPLHLDLLGLVVDLDTVHLNITAVPGAGNLLGNLLCAVAGLLDNTGGGGPLGAIQNLLNRILGILGGLGL